MNELAVSSGPRTPPALLGLFALLMLVPVTLPVPVLRGLVHDRFGVSELATSAFMSVNMIGAVLAAPLAGALADRLGHHKLLVIGALCLDALCFLGMTFDVPFRWFMALRFVEGCAHITALSLLLAIAADSVRRGAGGHVMGFVGGGLTLGVAIGAPIGGILGRSDPLRALEAAALIDLTLAIACLVWLTDARPVVARPRLGQLLDLVRRETSLLVPLAYAFVDRFTVGFFTTTFTLWMKRVHAMDPAHVGILLALFLGPFSLLSYPFGKLSERHSRVALVRCGSTCYGVGLMLLGLFSPGSLPFALFALGTLAAVMFVPSLVLTTDLAQREIRGTALGAFNAAGSLGFVVGPLVGGAVSQSVAVLAGDWHVGYSTAFAVAGASQLVCVLLTWPAMSRLRSDGRTT